jgi:hypothetical protein
MADGINYNLLTAELPTFGRAMEAARQRDMQNKLSQQQLAMSTMQFEQAKKEQAALAEMQRKFVENGKSPDLEVNFRAMIDSGIPHFVDVGTKGIQAVQRQKQFRTLLTGGDAAPVSAPQGVAPIPSEGLTSTPGVSVTAPVPDTMSSNALAAQNMPTPAEPVNELAALERKIQAAYTIGTPEALAWAAAREKELFEARKPTVVSPGASVYKNGKFVGTAPEKTVTPPALQLEYELAKEEGFKGTFLDFKRKMAEASRQPAQPTPVTPVTIVDPKDPSKTVVVDGRTGKVIGQGPKEPGVGVELSAKEKQAREAKYPQATAAVKTFETKSDSLAADLEKLAKHPGLSGISGFVYGRTPAVTKEARAAQALYDSIVARGGFAELQAMRASSPTGGALGNVSNQEGQYLRDAFAAISRTQDTNDLSAALKAAAEAVRGAKQRTREAYDLTYEYKTGGAKSAAPDPLGIR